MAHTFDIPVSAEITSQSLSVAPAFYWVPCIVDPATNEFQPLYAFSEFSERNFPADAKRAEAGLFSFRKDEWTREEDLVLYRHVMLHTPKAWSRIARELNVKFHGGRNIRIGKHCRGRWYNHLDPSIRSKCHIEVDWSPEEDIQLLQLQASIGNAWSLISKQMIGRNENTVKNRWNSLLKQGRLTHRQAQTDKDLSAELLRSLVGAREIEEIKQDDSLEAES